ncbi:MAG: hypothetical protein HOP19_00780 [Acidobacteria bacterium]|nr:hypothetical protein [Acidobacteriota bacterium]
MKKLMIAVLFVFALPLIGGAQKKGKPWTEWSEQEVTKMLNDSAWGQTQTDTDTSEMFYSPGSSASRNTQGALNQAVQLNFRLRLLSAKPIRQAYARRVLLKNPEMAAQLKAFAEQQSDKYIVVAVEYDGADRRFTGPAFQAFGSTNTAALKNATYLERKDGKRVFLEQYLAPGKDGMGAKFVFPRKLEGEDGPFIKEDSGYLRFYAEVGKDIKLNMRFKVQEMIYEGALEY